MSEERHVTGLEKMTRAELIQLVRSTEDAINRDSNELGRLRAELKSHKEALTATRQRELNERATTALYRSVADAADLRYGKLVIAATIGNEVRAKHDKEYAAVRLWMLKTGRNPQVMDTREILGSDLSPYDVSRVHAVIEEISAMANAKVELKQAT